MKTTMTLSQNLNINPFEIMDRDCDEVILLINFYILLGNEKQGTISTNKSNKEKRVKVTDSTATGGWF